MYLATRSALDLVDHICPCNLIWTMNGRVSKIKWVIILMQGLNYNGKERRESGTNIIEYFTLNSNLPCELYLRCTINIKQYLY